MKFTGRTQGVRGKAKRAAAPKRKSVQSSTRRPNRSKRGFREGDRVVFAPDTVDAVRGVEANLPFGAFGTVAA